MSYEAVKWALYDAPMPLTDTGRPDTTARAVLVVLAEHADAQGLNAYPSPDRISLATGHDERTCRRALTRLSAAQLIHADGVSRVGTARWKLAMEQQRPESDIEAAEARRRAESAARQARRKRRTSALGAELDRARDPMSGTEGTGHVSSESGTQDPGHIEPDEFVRDAASQCPVRTVPDVRYAAPPEPPIEPPGTTSTGEHAAPQTPLRPEAPTTSGLRTEHPQDPVEGQPTTNSPDRNHRPRAQGSTVRPPLAARLAEIISSRAQDALTAATGQYRTVPQSTGSAA